MEENKNNSPMDEDLKEVIIEELSTEEDNKKRLKRRIFNIVYDVLILIGIGCLIYGGYSLYEGYRDSKEAEESHEELKDNYVTVPTLPSIPNVPDKPNNPNNPDSSGAPDASTGSENVETQVPDRPREWYEQIRVDIAGMQTNINPDIIGWIHFENETISYPLLYSEDNAEYQRVRYDLVYSRGGSIFLEETNSWDLSDIRNVIYGHNMKDLSMFGKLKYYNDKKNYYKDHQYFQLLYGGMVYRYQIFSYFTIHQNEVGYINTNFEKGSDRYGEFLQKLVKNSKKDTGVEVDANDKTITLVTCSKDNTYRFIVSAVLVDQHTMANADGTFPDEPSTDEPSTDEPSTDEPSTDEPSTDEPGTDEPSTDEPGTDEPDTGEPGTDDTTIRPGANNYTYTDIGKKMMATVSVKIRNKPTKNGVKIAILGKHNEVYVEAMCNETGWYRVRYGSNFRRIGYINGKYLTEENLHLKNPVFGGTADAHLKCGDCGDALSADHVLVETTTEAGTIVYLCECGYMTEIPPEPGTSEPSTDEPGTSEPSTEEPGTSEPSTEEPGTSEPSTEEPGTSEPSTEEPGTSEPSTEEPGTSESGTEEPSESESEIPREEPSESESQSGSEEPSESESQSASGDASESENQDTSEEPSESGNLSEPTEQ